MAAKKKAPHGSKTSFVTSLPRELPAKEVVAKAKAEGMTISEAHVYKIRSTNKPTTGGKSAPRKPGRPAARSSDGGSKKDFVLSFPSSTPAAEIIAAAKGKGVALSRAYLYMIRSKAGTTAPRGATPRVPARRGDAKLEGRFLDLLLDVGLRRSGEILQHLRTRMHER